MKKLLFLFIPLMILAVAGCDDGTNGIDGANGVDGVDGLTPVVEVFDVAVSEKPCIENGGSVVTITIGDKIRIIDICNATDGLQGPQGDPGDDGVGGRS